MFDPGGGPGNGHGGECVERSRMVKQTNYSRGYYAESRAVKALEAEGFIAVRTAGSHGPWKR